MDGFWRTVPFVVGMIHLEPLPASARFAGSLGACMDAAQSDAAACLEGGVDAILIENHGDAPFARERVAPHVAGIMAILVRDLRIETGLPIGVNCLRNDALTALGVAAAGGATFVRVNVLAGVTATDQGLIQGCAESLLAYRRSLGVDCAIFADLDVKYGTPLYRPPLRDGIRSLVDRGGADAVIVTGPATGSPPDVAEVAAVREVMDPGTPLVLGSGVSAQNVREFGSGIAGFIVGTSIKKGADVAAPVDRERVRAFVDAVRSSG